MPTGELHVTVVEGQELTGKSGGIGLNPYCWITLRDQRRRTDTKDNGEPHWDQLVMFNISEGDDRFVLEVFSDAGSESPEFIGGTEVWLNPVFQNPVNNAWYDIYKRNHEYAGKVHLVLGFEPANIVRPQQPQSLVQRQQTAAPQGQGQGQRPGYPPQGPNGQMPPPYYAYPPPPYGYGPPPPPPVYMAPPPAQVIYAAPPPPSVVYVNDPYYDPLLGVGVGLGVGALAFGAYGRPWGYHHGWGYGRHGWGGHHRW